MVTRYDVISSRWSSHSVLSEKACFFQLFSGMKLNFVDKMTQNIYLCVITPVTCKTLLILSAFIWFLILDKIQDGDHVWWRQKPPAVLLHTKYISSCWEDQELSTEGKIVSKYCNVSKNKGVPTTPPPPHLLYHGEVWLCVYVQGLMNQTAQLQV